MKNKDINNNENTKIKKPKLSRKELKAQKEAYKQAIDSHTPKLSLYCIGPQNWSPDVDADRFRKGLPPLAYTYVATKEEANEFCDRFFFVKRYNHFRMWCNLRNKNLFDPSVWEEYVDIVAPETEEDAAPEEVLTCFKVTYSAEEITALMRILSLSLPVGAAWETDAELAAFEKFYQKIGKPLFVEMHDNLEVLKKDAANYNDTQFSGDDTSDDSETDIFA